MTSLLVTAYFLGLNIGFVGVVKGNLKLVDVTCKSEKKIQEFLLQSRNKACMLVEELRSPSSFFLILRASDLALCSESILA